MDHDLARAFADQQSNIIDWDGPLYSMYELSTNATELTVRFVSAIEQPVQGLRLKVRGGTFEIDSTSANDLVLWHDTAPEIVRVRIRWKSRGARSLRIWNAWRINNVTQAWLGNAGMRVEGNESTLTFRCSDGEGAPDFGDLIAEVALA
jgi:hypothetical protein